jgi:heme/copper-type cytochrome/quinol oxidase subunit 1
MFTNARYYIKTAFGFFIVGILAGLYLYGATIFGWYIPPTLISAHTHVILMGGMLMMILGVAIWFFPRAPKEDRAYNPMAISVLYWLFTISTLLRFVVEVLAGFPGSNHLRTLAFFIAIVQVGATVGLIYSIWGRIRPVGSQLREEKGQRF